MSTTYEKMLAIMAAAQDRPDRVPPSCEEHEIQCSCVEWFRYQYPNLSMNLFAVPNGGYRSKATAGKLKAEGVIAGVSDLILLVRKGDYGALLIEMKNSKERQSDSQKLWQGHIEKYGYRYALCRSLEDFQREVTTYLSK